MNNPLILSLFSQIWYWYMFVGKCVVLQVWLTQKTGEESPKNIGTIWFPMFEISVPRGFDLFGEIGNLIQMGSSTFPKISSQCLNLRTRIQTIANSLCLELTYAGYPFFVRQVRKVSPKDNSHCRHTESLQVFVSAYRRNLEWLDSIQAI